MAPCGSLGYLPMGYKFRPTDDELLGYYLLNKVRSTSFMYDNVVPEADLYGTLEPWDIWNAFGGQQLEKGEKDLYFFTKLKRLSATDSRIARGIGTGTWLGENAGIPVRDPRNNQLLGTWKRFHYKNTKLNHQDGCWIMHEYSLAPSVVDKIKSSICSSASTSTSTTINDIDDSQVLCRLRINIDKKRKQESQGHHNNNNIQQIQPVSDSGNHSGPHHDQPMPLQYCTNYGTGQSDNVVVGVGTTTKVETGGDGLGVEQPQLDVSDYFYNGDLLDSNLLNWIGQIDEGEAEAYHYFHNSTSNNNAS